MAGWKLFHRCSMYLIGNLDVPTIISKSGGRVVYGRISHPDHIGLGKRNDLQRPFHPPSVLEPLCLCPEARETERTGELHRACSDSTSANGIEEGIQETGEEKEKDRHEDMHII